MCVHFTSIFITHKISAIANACGLEAGDLLLIHFNQPSISQSVDVGTLDQILELHKKLRHMKSPMGSKESPARSCLDLLLENPNIEDG